MLVLLAAIGRGQTTVAVSVATDGSPGNDSSWYPSISADGRFVSFSSTASNLAPGDSRRNQDIYLRDRRLGTTERVSVPIAAGHETYESYNSSISTDGRFVAFDSSSSTLVPGDTNGVFDVFVRDRRLGTTERVSVSTGGLESDDYSAYPSISADGRFVAFTSRATNLVPGDANGVADIFVRDRLLGTTKRVSVSSSGAESDGVSDLACISADGSWVAFDSEGGNLVPSDTNGQADVFVHDLRSGTTELASPALGGGPADSWSEMPVISANGRFVAFASYAANLVQGDTNDSEDIFVRDRWLGLTERVSITDVGGQAYKDSWYPSISGDGVLVAFATLADGMVHGDHNEKFDVIVRDRRTQTTEHTSVTTGGRSVELGGTMPSISGDGRYVAFQSPDTNLATGNCVGTSDIFLRDRDTHGFPVLCEPGSAGIADCPCRNPPAGPGRGCDNVASTGGASLSVAGTSRLSADTLAFTVSGEPDGALSLLLEAKDFFVESFHAGHGVGCFFTIAKPLFERVAVGGSFTVPDPGHGDPSVSARSAARGDAIQPGTIRWYVVHYRDSGTLGPCTIVRDVNTTQVLQATWGP